MGPAEPATREPTLDAMRGFAVLGIMVVNIHFLLAAGSVPPFGGLDGGDGTSPHNRLIVLLTTWLAMGKFMPALAMLFGAGAAVLADRAAGRGVEPQALLRRRYRWLAAIGLVHMVFLFPGDILFAYGIAGLVLVRSLHLSPRSMLKRAAVLLAVGTTLFATLLGSLTWVMRQPDLADSIAQQEARAAAVYGSGTYFDIVRLHAADTPGMIAMGALMLPWTLSLFLAGAAVARTGFVTTPAAFSTALRRAATIGLGAGLPLNLAVALVTTSSGESPGIGATLLASGLVSVAGPLLATGYLASLALFCIRRGPNAPLVGVGRMALTAYLFQSVVMLVAVAGARLHGRLDAAGSLLIVAATWAVLLAGCPLWLRRFRFGPAEWLWRSLTYRRREPTRT